METAILVIVRRDSAFLTMNTDDLKGGLFPRIDFRHGESSDDLKSRVLKSTGVDVSLDMSTASEITYLVETSQKALPHFFALYSGQNQGKIDRAIHRWTKLRNLPLHIEHYTDKNVWEQENAAVATGLRALTVILRQERKKWDYSNASSESLATLKKLCFDVCAKIEHEFFSSEDEVSIEDELLDDYLYLGYRYLSSKGTTDESVDAKTAAFDEQLASGPVTEELAELLKKIVCLLAARSREFMLSGEKDRFYHDIQTARRYLIHIVSFFNEPLLVQRARKGGKAKAEKAQTVAANLQRIKLVIASVVGLDKAKRQNENNLHLIDRLMPQVLEALKNEGLDVDEITIKDEFLDFLIKR
jgi:hypothetical protein